jgi:hypothetical protein
MKQISLAATGFELATKRTGKREFLDERDWQRTPPNSTSLFGPVNLALAK